MTDRRQQGADAAPSHEPVVSGALPNAGARPARHTSSRPDRHDWLDRVTTDIEAGMLRIEIPNCLPAGFEKWLIATLQDDERREAVGPVSIEGCDQIGQQLTLVYEEGVRVTAQGQRAMYGPRTGNYIVIDAPMGTNGHTLFLIVNEFLADVKSEGGFPSTVPGISIRPADPSQLSAMMEQAQSVYRDAPSYGKGSDQTPTALEVDGCVTIQDNDLERFIAALKQLGVLPSGD